MPRQRLSPHLGQQSLQRHPGTVRLVDLQFQCHLRSMKRKAQTVEADFRARLRYAARPSAAPALFGFGAADSKDLLRSVWSRMVSLLDSTGQKKGRL